MILVRETTRARGRRERDSHPLAHGRKTLKRLAVTTVLAALGMLVTSGAAMAATPCWQRLINDWYDGRIDKIYPVKCYQQAIRNAPEDAKEYSDLPDDLTRALQAAIRGRGAGGSRTVPPSRFGHDPPTPGQPERSVAPNQPNSGRDEPKGPIGQVFDFLGPNNADSIPLPLIFLAALALLLMGTGAAGLVARRLQARRAGGEPPPADPPAGP